MIRKLKSFLSFIGIIASLSAISQTKDSTKNFPLVISGYIDAYYAYYTDSLGTTDYQKFPSVSPRSNQIGLNTICLDFNYDAEKVRATVGLHFGDIPRSAWSGNIMQAYAGVRLCKKLWIDAGFFRTHVGTEGLLPKENIANSVSLTTYYEPYFESGIRLNYNATEKLAINLFLLNGYNIYEDNNNKKSYGALITYALGENGNIGYSNYIGDDSPQGDTINHLRMLHNLFFNYQITKLKIQIGGDYCTQKNSNITIANKTAAMYSGVIGLKYAICSKFSVYGRGEIFNDEEGFMTGVIIDNTGLNTGYKEWGATLGFEFDPTESSYIKIEARQITMDKDQEIFRWNNKNTNVRMEAMLTLGISF